MFFQPSYGKWSMGMEELTKADNGNYTCVVCNILGCIEHTLALHVQGKFFSYFSLKLFSVNFCEIKEDQKKCVKMIYVSLFVVSTPSKH